MMGHDKDREMKEGSYQRVIGEATNGTLPLHDRPSPSLMERSAAELTYDRIQRRNCVGVTILLVAVLVLSFLKIIGGSGLH